MSTRPLRYGPMVHIILGKLAPGGIEHHQEGRLHLALFTLRVPGSRGESHVLCTARGSLSETLGDFQPGDTLLVGGQLTMDSGSLRPRTLALEWCERIPPA